jgi:glycosyltransferase involved in cell wall biosynthesis
MKIKDITVLIPSLNEERNIKKCLDLLKDFKSIIILDSNSHDKTRLIASKYENVKFIKTKINNYVSKLNILMSLSKTKWVLLIDADYEINNKLKFFLKKKKLLNSISGYKFNIFNVINEVVIWENIYPSKILLINKNKAFFKRDGHKEKLIIKGKIKHLDFYFLHNDKKNKHRWMDTQKKWASYDAIKIMKTDFKNLRIIEKLRIFPFITVIVALIYYFCFKRIYRYGNAGFLYLFQRMIYETTVNLIIIKLIFKKITNSGRKS